eukprot:TRINITY_DN5253_c0_g1_i2.p1 TRINITY_DN5253_c0_g1~~TRINITY_DN5253_c0_g1_i2.p1  ORF type:complete len:115 (+),score=5.27 TRINITY_DN5253_c0_g1_i2:231-575(+)
MPNAERLKLVVALKPIAGTFAIGCSPYLFSTASNTTGLVTPLTVKLPVILKCFLSLVSTLVLLKVMFGYFAALNQASSWNSLSKATTLVFTLLKGIVTSTDEFEGFALSTLIVP